MITNDEFLNYLNKFKENRAKNLHILFEGFSLAEVYFFLRNLDINGWLNISIIHNEFVNMNTICFSPASMSCVEARRWSLFSFDYPKSVEDKKVLFNQNNIFQLEFNINQKDQKSIKLEDLTINKDEDYLFICSKNKVFNFLKIKMINSIDHDLNNLLGLYTYLLHK